MRLTKHHGLGNDFLIAITSELPADAAALARSVCCRTRGVGADGLILALPGNPALGTDATMVLFNADGGRAEMSGNGIRCMAQAILRQNAAAAASFDTPSAFPSSPQMTELRIGTDVGVRTVAVEASDDSCVVHVKVDMGPITQGPPIQSRQVQLALGNKQVAAQVGSASLGNPHVVLGLSELDPSHLDLLDIAAVGAQQSAAAGDSNVEAITPGPDAHSITMRVWERGVGVTEACGTGACAAAHLAHGWGWVGGVVTVHMSGGQVVVELGDTAILGGPATYIATVEYGPVEDDSMEYGPKQPSTAGNV